MLKRIFSNKLFACLFISVQFVLTQIVLAEEGVFWSTSDLLPQVQVAEPFVEWRTGPAQGYPVFHVSEKGEWLSLLIRKTNWMKVKDSSGKEGWIAIADLLKTLDGSGNTVSLVEPKFDDFSTRRWEAGLMAGEFESTAVNAAYMGYWMTEHLSLELWGSQVLGRSSEIRMLNVNILHQPLPSWRLSPFVTMGAGKVFVKPKATLVNESSRSEDAIHFGLGARFYINDRYFLRMEVKDYKVFTDRETNEEAIEWKLGLSVFF